MNELITQSDLKPVSFEQKKPALTWSQKIIIELLNESIQKVQMVKREDIEKAYLRYLTIKNGGTKLNWGAWRGTDLVNSDYVKYRCLGWFKSNLGACILKAKLVVIPVIDDI